MIALVVFLVVLIRSARHKEVKADEVDDALAQVGYGKIFIWLVLGGVALYLGSKWLVEGATEIAENIGVSEGVISITMIAIGTSVPELAASIIAAIKGEKAISLGNLIGSNIFNIASVLGITALIKEIPVTEPQILTRDIFWMLGFSLVLLPLVFLPKKYSLSRVKGVVLFLSYGVFIYLVFKTAA
jgi:cation:H+ antiporter